jgi:hypothetical protein
VEPHPTRRGSIYKAFRRDLEAHTAAGHINAKQVTGRARGLHGSCYFDNAFGQRLVANQFGDEHIRTFRKPDSGAADIFLAAASYVRTDAPLRAASLHPQMT